MKRKIKSVKKNFLGVQIVAVGALTGAFVGVAVTLYNALFELCEEVSRGCYGYVRTHPAFIPLLFLALFLGAVVIGGTLHALPILRGSGFPQTEGAAQGLLRFKWYKVLVGMFAASLVSVILGLSAGSEGPSLMMGGAMGDGLSGALRRNAVMRRYQITGGACAGLAVALNAPLTGIVFAYEETHKRFTPEVFACSFSSVVVAVVIRSVLAPLLGLFNAPIFGGFEFTVTSVAFLPYTMLAAAIVSVCGVAFYYLTLLARRLIRKIRAKKWVWVWRMTVPFLLAGAAGLITAHAMGSGVSFIETLGEGIEHVEPLFSTPVWATLLIIVGVRFLVTVVNAGAETPCCSSLPIFAIGAGMGAMLSLWFVKMGMDPSLADTLIVISLATFFATVVKAPFTSIIMTVELTGSFTFLLPVVMSVAISYMAGSIFRTEPLYEKFLEDILEERGVRPAVRVEIVAGDQAAGREIRDILWPGTAHVTEIVRGDTSVVPLGGTVIEENDRLTVEGAPLDREEYFAALRETVGEIVSTEEADTMSANGPPEK